MTPVIDGPKCNRLVTCDKFPSNDRSESAIAVNPLNPYNMIGASKRFTDPATYAFSLTTYATFDGGQSWIESAPLSLPQIVLISPLPFVSQPKIVGTSDPAVAWDNQGNAYLVALPFQHGKGGNFAGKSIGIAVYQSTDGGRTWGPPNLIHQSDGGDPNDELLGDDKQWAAGDAAVARTGNVYIVWDDIFKHASYLRFARTTDHGVSWKGTEGQPAGTAIDGITDSNSPEVFVAPDTGNVYIVWLGTDQQTHSPAIKFVKSTDGGDSFTAPAIVATGIRPLDVALPKIDGWPHFPGATFRVVTYPTGCVGSGEDARETVVVAWANAEEKAGEEPLSRIHYRRSTDGGNTWLGSGSGDPLLTGAAGARGGWHDFHPQLVSTPNGEIGCAFYRYTEGIEIISQGQDTKYPGLIDVLLAVSTDNATTFPNVAQVTDQAWDPAVDAPYSFGDPNVTFIGDYFGLDASRLGFFPFWTDTRTGVQEIFTSRIAVNPADVFIRDSTLDTGDAPSPSWFSLKTPDLIVRSKPRSKGDTSFVNEDIHPDPLHSFHYKDHYIYASVTNRGPNDARNVRLSVIQSWYHAGPGLEFRYPYDWYPDDWATLFNYPGVGHRDLGESAAVATIPSGETRILGPVIWPSHQIIAHSTLLAEVRADNDDSAGGPNGCDVPADPGPCYFGSFYFGNNNVTKLTPKIFGNRAALYGSGSAIYQPPPEFPVNPPFRFPFVVGSPWSVAQYLEVIVEKARQLSLIPMMLRMEPMRQGDEMLLTSNPPSELILTENCRVVIRVDERDVGELIASPGTIWRPLCSPRPHASLAERCYGGEKVGQEWRLTQPRGAVGFPIASGELRLMTLSFHLPATLSPGAHTLARIFQRNDTRVIAGSISLDVEVG